MQQPPIAGFSAGPQPTVFIVNVIHPHPGKQEEAFRLIQDVVHYVAARKEGFLWSNLSKSTDGKTVVNVEAIADEGNVGEFFSDPVFLAKFRALDAVSSSEFHTYRVDDLVLPRRAVGSADSK
ncbi:antibiotic biosynthesis monooxygenase [Ensifer sp. 2YAB10]|uniref:antibiotic biosynthesis monooxygenase n=1 Tax=unclassified Ensifer TaxID=2633371 RepID=UPI000DE3F4E1